MRPHLWAPLGVSAGLLTAPGQAFSPAMPEGFQSLPMFSSHVSQARVPFHNTCSELRRVRIVETPGGSTVGHDGGHTTTSHSTEPQVSARSSTGQ